MERLRSLIERWLPLSIFLAVVLGLVCMFSGCAWLNAQASSRRGWLAEGVEPGVAPTGAPMGATTGAPAKGLTNGELVLQAGGVVAIALGLPYVPLVLGLIRARKSFGQLVKNVHDATREDPADRKHPKLDLEALEVANVRTGLQPKVLRPLDAAKAAKRETG